MSVPTEQPHDAVDVLLIEDEAVQSPIRRRLQQAGYRVRAATDGIKGLLQTRSALPRLMIVDVNLPGLSGFEILGQVRAQPRYDQLPIVMLSSMKQEKDIARGFELGANDFLYKPFSPNELLLRLQRYLRA